MATELDDLTLHLDPSLYLPIRGRVYEIPSPTIVDSDRLRDLIWAEPLGADELHAEIIAVLGDAHQKMIDDGVLSAERDHAGMTAIVHFGASPTLGRMYWEFEHLAAKVDISVLLERIKAA